jgi:hypothetical protein
VPIDHSESRSIFLRFLPELALTMVLMKAACDVPDSTTVEHSRSAAKLPWTKLKQVREATLSAAVGTMGSRGIWARGGRLSLPGRYTVGTR